MSYVKYYNSTLHLGKHSLSDLVKYYKGPLYVYDLSILEERYKQYSDSLPKKTQIFYAMKANPNRAILNKLKLLGSKIDVVSKGEILRALEVGFHAKDIIFSGVGKTKDEILTAIEYGIYQINVESVPELARIIQIAQDTFNKTKHKTDIVFRINPNIDIKTHPYIATGLHENKFGMEISALSELIPMLKSAANFIQLKGISLHLGSQMHDLDGFQEALQKLKPVFQDLKKDFPSCDRFDVGGGLGIFYDQTNLQKELELLNEYAQIIKDELDGLDIEIQTEPGRWLVAHCGLLISQVQYIKNTPYKKFVILDTGMNHLMRPALYQAYHQILPLIEHQDRKYDTYDVVGPICESSDVIGKNRSLQELKADEFVAILDTGAYGFSMANVYNLHELPHENIL